MNKAEESIKKKYRKQGYKCLHNKGFCDFIFFKVIENKPTEVIFVEVKTPQDRLNYEQQIFRKVVDSLGLNYRIEIVDTHPKPSHTTPNHANPRHSRPGQTKPLRLMRR